MRHRLGDLGLERLGDVEGQRDVGRRGECRAAEQRGSNPSPSPRRSSAARSASSKPVICAGEGLARDLDALADLVAILAQLAPVGAGRRRCRRRVEGAGRLDPAVAAAVDDRQAAVRARTKIVLTTLAAGGRAACLRAPCRGRPAVNSTTRYCTSPVASRSVTRWPSRKPSASQVVAGLGDRAAGRRAGDGDGLVVEPHELVGRDDLLLAGEHRERVARDVLDHEDRVVVRVAPRLAGGRVDVARAGERVAVRVLVLEVVLDRDDLPRAGLARDLDRLADAGSPGPSSRSRRGRWCRAGRRRAGTAA